MPRFHEDENGWRIAGNGVGCIGRKDAKQQFMTIEFFNEHYSHLPDTEDASTVIGVLPNIATVGDIRAACTGHPRTSRIYPKIDGSGFYISDVQSTFLS